ncbi:MAG: FAD-binding oxidoreductase [Gammaproteobacteria bacterium]|nr:FAD-binding oxidoreductase [Gammaproteobacteria bacterium]
MAFKIFPMRVTDSRHVTPSILQLSFERDDGEKIEYQAGQFINIHFENDGKKIHRSYSIANTPGGEWLEIAMSPVEGGRATRLLSGLSVGDVIEGSGPYGRFILKDDEPTRYVMLATGTGVTPYRAMLPLLEERIARGFSVDVLLGIWRREEALYADEFLAFAEQQPGFTFHVCYSRDMPDEVADHECEGYVQARMQQLDMDPERDIVYLCGNPDMVDQAMAWLKELGFPIARLRREKYLPSRR